MTDNNNYPLADKVLTQLQRISEQPEMKRSPILIKFLEFVVRAKLDGADSKIKEYTIGVNALGRSADFNPQIDSIVRIHAARLRRALVEYYHGAGIDDILRISIPKGSYIPVFETKENKVNGYHIPIEEENHPRSSFGSDVFTKPVVAVLPFYDQGIEIPDKNLITSVGEQLSCELSRFESLSVISYYATRDLHSDIRDLKQLREDSGIDYILNGSLRLWKETLKLSMQLMAVDSGTIFWSECYLRHHITEQNVFEIVDEIISEVATIIAGHGRELAISKLKPRHHDAETDVVQEAIYRYFNYTYNYGSGHFENLLLLVEKAFILAPDNSIIVSILAKIHLDLYAFSIESNLVLLEKGLELANLAVQLDLRSHHAQKALAWGEILSGYKDKYIDAVERSVLINPIASGNLGTPGMGLMMLGEYEKGFMFLKQSAHFYSNPSAYSKLGLAVYYFHNKNYRECSKWLERMPPFSPPFARLLQLALHGLMHGASPPAVEMLQDLKGHEVEIIDRIVRDPELKKEIFHGWHLAGHYPEQRFQRPSA